MNFPFIGFRIVVIVIVLSIGDVVMMNALDDRSVTVVFVQIEIIAPPLFTGRGVVVGIEKRVEVRAVGRLRRPLIIEAARSRFHFVKVSVGQFMLIQHVAIGLLERQIEPLKIGIKLSRASFRCIFDNSKLHVIRIRTFDACEVE